MIGIAVVALVDLLIAGAIELVWRRRREAQHARSWTAAFLLAAAGWAVTAWTNVLENAAAPPGAAASLCWVGAVLLFVHGLRLRGGRSGRAGVLAAIWGGCAFGIALLGDLPRLEPEVADAAVQLLSALALLLAAVAIVPRTAPAARLDAGATGLLALLALSAFALAWLHIAAPAEARMVLAVAPMLAVPAHVALGLMVMLLLNDDLRTSLDRLARTDPLTRVWNRRGFEEGAAALLARLRATPGRLAAVAIADIDSFKAINDQHGHHAGDAALVRFARQLGTITGEGDLLARLGGEEFALLAIGIDGAALMERVERARVLISLPDQEGNPPVTLTASFGVAQLSTRGLSLRDALERADRALYRAKVGGKNRTMLAEPGTME